MSFFKSLQKIVDKANNVTNKVMKVTDPIGAYLKVETETKSQEKVKSILGGLFSKDAPQEDGYEDLGGTTARSDETLQSAKDKKYRDGKMRRQGVSGGSTLITSTEDEEQKMNKSTLLGM